MLENQFYLLSVFAFIIGILTFVIPQKKTGMILVPGLALMSAGLWTMLALTAVAIEIPVNTHLWNTSSNSTTLATSTVMYRSLNVHWIYYMFAVFFFVWFVLLTINTLKLLGEEPER